MIIETADWSVLFSQSGGADRIKSETTAKKDPK